MSNVSAGLPEVLQSTIGFYRDTTLQERLKYRAEKLGFWLKRVVALKQQECELKASMDGEVAQILRDKNILLWQEMLASVEYPDMDVVEEMKSGTDLVGPAPRTGLWPQKFQPSLVTLEELCDLAVRDRAGLQQQFSNVSGADHVNEVWEKTMDEVRAGLLEGPLDLADVPTNYPLSRRFGIQQGNKVRCIDDFSRSAVNSAAQTCESPKPHTVDVFAAMCVNLMGAISDDTPWVGRTFDLIGAYRQCAINPNSKQFSYIVAQRPSSLELACFRMKALPFGAVRSVHGFLRVAHSLWYLLTCEFKVLLTNYIDDFVAVAPECESGAITSCVNMFFKLLGWAFSESGDKAPPFSSLFQALGVTINVSGTAPWNGSTWKHCKQEQRNYRILRLGPEQRTYDKARGTSLERQASIHVWQCFWPSWQVLLVGNYQPCLPAAGHDFVAGCTGIAIRLHRHLLADGRPRELKPASCEPWFIQTDASYDEVAGTVDAGIGAVLFNPQGKPVSYFSKKLPVELIGKRISQAECHF